MSAALYACKFYPPFPLKKRYYNTPPRADTIINLYNITTEGGGKITPQTGFFNAAP